MDDSRMWCPYCDRMTIPNVKLNYPMPIGVSCILIAITFVFIWVTFLDHTWTVPETVGLTLLVTALPFCYMRLRRMKANLYTCPDCGSQELIAVPTATSATDVRLPSARPRNHGRP